MDPQALESEDSGLCYILTLENVADKLLIPGWPHTLHLPNSKVSDSKSTN